MKYGDKYGEGDHVMYDNSVKAAKDSIIPQIIKATVVRIISPVDKEVVYLKDIMTSGSWKPSEPESSFYAEYFKRYEPTYEIWD
jgi:hypothetical protein